MKVQQNILSIVVGAPVGGRFHAGNRREVTARENSGRDGRGEPEAVQSSRALVQNLKQRLVGEGSRALDVVTPGERPPLDDRRGPGSPRDSIGFARPARPRGLGQAIALETCRHSMTRAESPARGPWAAARLPCARGHHPGTGARRALRADDVMRTHRRAATDPKRRESAHRWQSASAGPRPAGTGPACATRVGTRTPGASDAAACLASASAPGRARYALRDLDVTRHRVLRHT